MRVVAASVSVVLLLHPVAPVSKFSKNIVLELNAMFPGQVIVGIVVSVTVTVNEQLAEFPAAS
jgi:hypothetical protein